jgi:hypothetical protein
MSYLERKKTLPEINYTLGNWMKEHEDSKKDRKWKRKSNTLETLLLN